jgi:uncharacterized protein YkwD
MIGSLFMLGAGVAVWYAWPAARQAKIEKLAAKEPEGKQLVSPVAPPREEMPTKEKPSPEPPRNPVLPPPKPPVVELPPADPDSDALGRKVLTAINAQRRLAGRKPVRLDAEHSRGCAEHALYLAKNANQPDLDPHEQVADLPGATPAGAEAARTASVIPHEPVEAVNNCLAVPAHRALLLDPALASVGVGQRRTAKGKWICVLDFLRGSPKQTPGSGSLRGVLYPVHRQKDVPLAFPGNEVPDPLPLAKIKMSGYPITVIFPPHAPVPSSRAWLEDESGKDVPVWFSSPTQPANDRHARNQQNTVCLFARKVLRPGTRYVVHVQANAGGQEWSRTWSFTTVSPADVHRRIYERALARLNTFRQSAGLKPVRMDVERSKACMAHADYLARHLEQTPDVRINEERSDLPGYTKAGQEVGAHALIRLGCGFSPSDAIDWIMASVLNRHFVLNPALRSAAFGAALHGPRAGAIWVISIPFERTGPADPQPTLYPGPDQTEVPLYFGRDLSTLMPGQPKGTAAGFAVTVNFPPGQRVNDVEAVFADAGGKELECWVSTPEKMLPGAGRYNQIVLVPKKPLSPASIYAARVRAVVNGKPWTRKWSFTTFDMERYQKQIGRALLDRVNRARALAGLDKVTLDPSLSKGCGQHARYVARNIEHPRVQGLGIHEEDASLPGATPAGKKAGHASVIAIITNPLDSVDSWIATLYHRIPLLDPRLKKLGYGQAQHATRGWVTVLDSSSGR